VEDCQYCVEDNIPEMDRCFIPSHIKAHGEYVNAIKEGKDPPVYLRCTLCYHELNFGQSGNVNCCPKCEDPGVPMSPDDGVTIDINWHELRILCIWAERWASDFIKNEYSLKTVRAIASRIEKQRPEKKTPLTFLGEIKQLEKQYGEVKQNVVQEDDGTFPII